MYKEKYKEMHSSEFSCGKSCIQILDLKGGGTGRGYPPLLLHPPLRSRFLYRILYKKFPNNGFPYIFPYKILRNSFGKSLSKIINLCTPPFGGDDFMRIPVFFRESARLPSSGQFFAQRRSDPLNGYVRLDRSMT